MKSFNQDHKCGRCEQKERKGKREKGGKEKKNILFFFSFFWGTKRSTQEEHLCSSTVFQAFSHEILSSIKGNTLPFNF